MSTQYLQIPRNILNIKEGTKFIDILVYSILEFNKDGSTFKSRIAYDTISKSYNIPYKDVERSIKRLRENGFITYDQIKCENSEYFFNEYSFTCKDKRGHISTPYIELDKLVLKLELAPKDRGVLIALHLITMEGLNQIPFQTVQDVAKCLGITRQTASKYIKKFISINEMGISRAGYYYVKHINRAPEITNTITKQITITL